MKTQEFNQKGFTLIELLIVITIIAALAVAVFVALNPVKRLKDARDSRRLADVESILTAVHEYIVDNAGNLPAGLSSGMSESMLGTSGTSCNKTQANCVAAATACVDLSTPLVKYLKSMPIDPLGGTYSASFTGYDISVDSNNLVTVRGCGGENNTAISASR